MCDDGSTLEWVNASFPPTKVENSRAVRVSLGAFSFLSPHASFPPALVENSRAVGRACRVPSHILFRCRQIQPTVNNSKVSVNDSNSQSHTNREHSFFSVLQRNQPTLRVVKQLFCQSSEHNTPRHSQSNNRQHRTANNIHGHQLEQLDKV